MPPSASKPVRRKKKKPQRSATRAKIWKRDGARRVSILSKASLLTRAGSGPRDHGGSRLLGNLRPMKLKTMLVQKPLLEAPKRQTPPRLLRDRTEELAQSSSPNDQDHQQQQLYTQQQLYAQQQMYAQQQQQLYVQQQQQLYAQQRQRYAQQQQQLYAQQPQQQLYGQQQQQPMQYPQKPNVQQSMPQQRPTVQQPTYSQSGNPPYQYPIAGASGYPDPQLKPAPPSEQSPEQAVPDPQQQNPAQTAQGYMNYSQYEYGYPGTDPNFASAYPASAYDPNAYLPNADTGASPDTGTQASTWDPYNVYQ